MESSEKNSVIKKISYNAALIKTIRFLGLRPLARKMYYSFIAPKNAILETTLGGKQMKFYVRTADELRLAESVSGDWGEKPVIEALLANLHEGDAAYDVGANIGIYSIAMAKAVGTAGKVVAFEPEVESVKRLKENAELNHLSNVKVVEKALGRKNGTANLYIGKTTGNFSLVKSYEENLDHQSIDLVSGDMFVEQNQLPIPKAVKIDVEGYEYEVLLGLKKTLMDAKCKVICCEVHPGLFPDGVTEDQVLDLIKELGFTVFHPFKRAFSAYHVIAKKPE